MVSEARSEKNDVKEKDSTSFFWRVIMPKMIEDLL